MTDLTEQWKKGELPEGHYYIKTRSETNIDEYIQWYKDHGIPSEKSFAYFNVQQVLAPVPSYDEWEQLQNWADFTDDYHGLKEKLEIAEYENVELKELLKECRLAIFDYPPYDLASDKIRLTNKIDEVLK